MVISCHWNFSKRKFGSKGEDDLFFCSSESELARNDRKWIDSVEISFSIAIQMKSERYSE
jgi:hypothetical protein